MSERSITYAPCVASHMDRPYVQMLPWFIDENMQFVIKSVVLGTIFQMLSYICLSDMALYDRGGVALNEVNIKAIYYET